MSSYIGLIEAVMLEVVVIGFGLRELYMLRKDEKKPAEKESAQLPEKQTAEPHDNPEKPADSSS